MRKKKTREQKKGHFIPHLVGVSWFPGYPPIPVHAVTRVEERGESEGGENNHVDSGFDPGRFLVRRAHFAKHLSTMRQSRGHLKGEGKDTLEAASTFLQWREVLRGERVRRRSQVPLWQTPSKCLVCIVSLCKKSHFVTTVNEQTSLRWYRSQKINSHESPNSWMDVFEWIIFAFSTLCCCSTVSSFLQHWKRKEIGAY